MQAPYSILNVLGVSLKIIRSKRNLIIYSKIYISLITFYLIYLKYYISRGNQYKIIEIIYILWWITIRGLWQLPVGKDWLWGKLGLVMMGGGMLSKSLIQFSVDGQGCFPFLLFGLRPNYGGGNEDNVYLFKQVPCTHFWTQCPWSCSRPLLTHSSLEIPGHSQESLGQSLLGLLLLSPGFWCARGFVCALQECVSPVLYKFCNQILLASKVKISGCSQSLCQIPRLGNLCGP